MIKTEIFHFDNRVEVSVASAKLVVKLYLQQALCINPLYFEKKKLFVGLCIFSTTIRASTV